MNRKSAAKKFAKEAIEKFKDRVVSMLLFGSVARGDSAPSSDIDILVVWNGQKTEGWENLEKLAFSQLLETKRYISLKVLSPLEYEYMLSSHDPFLTDVIGYGIRLV